MVILTASERARLLEQENEALMSKCEDLEAELAYVAMMTDVDIPERDEEER